MGIRRGAGAAVLLAFLISACGSDAGDDVQWKATFSASEGDGSASGGLVIQAEGKTLALAEPWLLGEPAPFADPVPSVELASIGEALFHVEDDLVVVDAVSAPGGVVALLADPAGGLTLRHLADPVGVPVPEGARRVLLAGESPVRVLVVLGDGTALLATRAR